MFNPDHLSFSGTLQRRDGRILIVRRIFPAHSSSHWEHPVSGSPRPAETLIAAIRRCVERDLNIIASDAFPLLPTLGDHNVAANRPVNLHPAYVVRSDETPQLSPGRESCWMDPLELGRQARSAPEKYSPLLALHAAHLPFYGGSPSLTHTDIRHEKLATG